MAYTQTPGQTRGENPAISTLTNGGGEGKKKKKKVKSFNNETKETSDINVTSGSPADKLSKQVGNAIDYKANLLAVKKGTSRAELMLIK